MSDLRMVIWEDEDGYLHRSAIRSYDPDELAPNGIPSDPPTMDELDWGAIKRDLSNSLVTRGLFTHQDLIREQNSVTGAILFALRSRLITLYKKRRR